MSGDSADRICRPALAELQGWIRRLRGSLGLISCLAGLFFTVGCTRSYYRRQADEEVEALIETDIVNPGEGPLADFTIAIDPRSRMYSPYSPDFPPMPPDDPSSHTLMERVDGKRGSRLWNCYGTTRHVDNPLWRAYLPVDEDNILVLDRNAAVSTALLESPDFQDQLEELYLSALDVTFERFRFDTQFFGGSSIFYTADGKNRPGSGGRSSSLLDLSVFPAGNRLRAEKMFAAGGDLVVGVANSFVWQFAGPDTNRVNTLVDFTILQPLLRRAGRARVLERLTISERSLLANIRQMERFRRGFYVEVVTGRSAGSGPSRRGGFFGGAGLEGFSGVGGGGFGRVGGIGGGGGGAGVAGGAGAAAAGGFLGLGQDLQEIRNQEANVVGLRNSVDQLQSAHEAGRIDRYQVDLARQAFYNAESLLLTRKTAYESRLDNYKINLGLPPDLEVNVRDTLLDQFMLLDPTLIRVQHDATTLLDALRTKRLLGSAPITDQDVTEGVARATDLARRARVQMDIAQMDYEKFKGVLPTRKRVLEQLAARPNVGQDLDLEILNFDNVHWRSKALRQDLDQVARHITQVTDGFRQIEQETARPIDDRYRQLVDLLTRLSDQLFELSLLQARTRLDSVVIDPVAVTGRSALATARRFRRDWMNARANLVDRWRLIEFNANDLKSGLDVTFSGDIRNRNKNPLDLESSTGRLSVGLAFDAPLTRLSERNIYRQSLIEYQQARRQYYQSVDRIHQGLRNTLRTMHLDELNLELRREAVFVAISQVDLTRLRLMRPPKPGETSVFGDTTARDLVSALSDLLSVQNDFLSVWVNYEVQRIGLDFDLGTMQLDPQGMWIDPGTFLGQVQLEEGETDLLLPEGLPGEPPEAALPDAGPVEPLPEPDRS